MAKLTPMMSRVLVRAAGRERGNICPTPRQELPGNAEAMLLKALDRRGLIEWHGVGIPFINDAGRAAVEA